MRTLRPRQTKIQIAPPNQPQRTSQRKPLKIPMISRVRGRQYPKHLTCVSIYHLAHHNLPKTHKRHPIIQIPTISRSYICFDYMSRKSITSPWDHPRLSIYSHLLSSDKPKPSDTDTNTTAQDSQDTDSNTDKP